MAKHKELQKYIKIRKAAEHNLKEIDLDVPRDEFVVFTGLSGSGKSSLAFDTIYAEGEFLRNRVTILNLDVMTLLPGRSTYCG